MERSPLEKALVGPAGEHYVLYRLMREGFLATQAPRNAPTADLLVMNPDDETVRALVQVKTRARGDGGWMMSEKHEQVRRADLLYVLVDMEPEHPICYVLPAPIVADALANSHQAWLAQPGRRGQQRNDSSMRRIRATYGDRDVPGCPPGWLDQWRERWDLFRQRVVPA